MHWLIYRATPTADTSKGSPLDSFAENFTNLLFIEELKDLFLTKIHYTKVP